MVPVAPERTRVMLRQRFPKGAVLSTLLQLPGSEPMLTFLVRNRNYQLAVEDLMSESTGCRPQAEASDDLVTRFREWARTAQQGEGTQVCRHRHITPVSVVAVVNNSIAIDKQAFRAAHSPPQHYCQP